MSEKGHLLIAEADPRAHRRPSRAKVLTARCWAVPVLSGGRIFCRNHEGGLRLYRHAQTVVGCCKRTRANVFWLCRFRDYD